jgi:hypothetical protein
MGAIANDPYHLSKEKIATLINNLFPPTYKKDRSIQKLLIFPIYFTNQLFDQLSLAEFIRARQKGSGALMDYTNSSIEKGYTSELNGFYSQANEFENKDDFECIVNAKFYLASINKLDQPSKLLAEFSSKRLDEIQNEFYFRDNTELPLKINAWLKNYYSSHISGLVSEIILNYLKNRDYKFALTIEELQKIVLNNFIEHIETSKDITAESFSYYSTCIKEFDLNNEDIVLIKESNDLFRKFIIDHILSFIKLLIMEHGPTHHQVYTLRPYAEQIMGSKNGFEIFINELPTTTVDFVEVKAFYKKFKQNKFKPIEFKRGESLEFYNNILTVDFETLKFNEHPQFINKSNTDTISASFLTSPSGTFSAWVKLKPTNEYLSMPMNFEYLVAHSTNYKAEVIEGEYRYGDVFSISIAPDITHTQNMTPNTISWRVWISNAKKDSDYLWGPTIYNEKSEWYHLLVRWDHQKSIFEFIINGTIVANRKNYREFWPDVVLDTAVIGTWGNYSKIHYINSSVYRLMTSTSYLDDFWIKDELSQKPKE